MLNFYGLTIREIDDRNCQVVAFAVVMVGPLMTTVLACRFQRYILRCKMIMQPINFYSILMCIKKKLSLITIL